jgi:hypothetical protein
VLRNFCLPLLLLLTACGGLGARPKSGSSLDLVSGLSGGSANQLTAFYPASGTYSAVPATVLVSFASPSLDAAQAASLATYNIRCGSNGNFLAAQSVSYQAGLSTVTVSLPSITGLANGTVCTFSVSISLRDASGNFVVGQHTASYTINRGGGTWNEAASPTYTALVGSNSRSSFLDTGASGMVLTGLNVSSATSVNSVQGLWANGFGSSATSTGQAHGTSGGGYTQLACPAGYRLTGITGRSGADLDAIGIICKTEDQSQAYTSIALGGAGGASFTLSCPAGQFATDLGGGVDVFLDGLYLGCR